MFRKMALILMLILCSSLNSFATVSSTTSRMDYVGNGAVDTYAYNYRIFASTDLLVTVRDTDDVETTLAINTDYTVTGVGSSTGTIVLVNSAQAWLDGDGDLKTGYVLIIRRVRPLKQLTDIRNQGPYFPEIHEDTFDSLVMIDQQQQDELNRSMKLSETIDPDDFDPQLPANLALTPGATIVVNDAGNGFAAGPTTDEISNAQDSALAAAASAGAASTSASAAADSAAAAASSVAGTTNYWGGTVGGTANAITLTPATAITSYVAGQTITFLATGTNSTAVTVAVSGLATKSIKTQSGAALSSGEITSGRLYTITYDGTNFIAKELSTPEDGVVTNAKINASAAIVDTKLAQITTAGKVSGAAITSLTSVPSGAGLIPSVNVFPSGMIVMWSGTIATIPTGWELSDGICAIPCPDLRDKFVVGATSDSSGVAKTNITGSLTTTGGAVTVNLQHNHTGLTGIQSGIASGTGFAIGAADKDHVHSISNDLSATQSILNPYYALAFIIKD